MTNEELHAQAAQLAGISKRLLEPNLAVLKEPDWIALRLLYILLASDPSTTTLPDVQKTINYFEGKCRPIGSNPRSAGAVQKAFALLNKDIPYDGETFGAPNVCLTRNVVNFTT